MKSSLLPNQHVAVNGFQQKNFTESARSGSDNYLKVPIKNMRRGSAELIKTALCGLERRRASEQYIKIIPDERINTPVSNLTTLRCENQDAFVTNAREEQCRQNKKIQIPIININSENSGNNVEEESATRKAKKLDEKIAIEQIVDQQTNRLYVPLITIRKQREKDQVEETNADDMSTENAKQEHRKTDDIMLADLSRQNSNVSSEQCIKPIVAEADERPSNDVLLRAAAREIRSGSVLLLKQLIEQETQENHLEDNRRLSDIADSGERQDSMALQRQLHFKAFGGSKLSLNSLKSAHSIQQPGLTLPPHRLSIQLQQPYNNVTYI